MVKSSVGIIGLGAISMGVARSAVIKAYAALTGIALPTAQET
jgi:hypothetical protein